MSARKPWMPMDSDEDDDRGPIEARASSVDEGDELEDPSWFEGGEQAEPAASVEQAAADVEERIGDRGEEFRHEGEEYDEVVAAQGIPDDQQRYRRVSEQASEAEAQAVAAVQAVAAAPTQPVPELPTAPSSLLEPVRALPHQGSEVPREFRNILEVPAIKNFFLNLKLEDLDDPELIAHRLANVLNNDEVKDRLSFLELAMEGLEARPPAELEKQQRQKIDAVAQWMVAEMVQKTEQYLRSEIARQQSMEASVLGLTKRQALSEAGRSMVAGAGYATVLRMVETGMSWLPIPEVQVAMLAARGLTGGIMAVVMMKAPKLARKIDNALGKESELTRSIEQCDRLKNAEAVKQHIMKELQTDFAYVMGSDQRRVALAQEELDALRSLDDDTLEHIFGSGSEGIQKFNGLSQLIQSTFFLHEENFDAVRIRSETITRLTEKRVLQKCLNYRMAKKLREATEGQTLSSEDRRMLELELVIEMEERLNMLLSDVRAQEDAQSNLKHKQSFRESYTAVLLGTQPPETVAQTFIRGTAMGLVAGLVSGNKYTSAIYTGLRSLSGAFQKEMLGVSSKERAVKTFRELETEGTELAKRIEKGETTLSEVQAYEVDVRARIKLPGIRESDRARLQQQLRSIRYHFEGQRVFGAIAEHTDEEIERGLILRSRAAVRTMQDSRERATQISQEEAERKRYWKLLSKFVFDLSLGEKAKVAGRMAPRVGIAFASGLAGQAVAGACLNLVGFSEAAAATAQPDPAKGGKTSDTAKAGGEDSGEQGTGAPADQLKGAEPDASPPAVEPITTDDPIWKESGYQFDHNDTGQLQVTLDLKGEGSVDHLEQAYAQIAALSFQTNDILVNETLSEGGAAKILNVAENLAELTKGRGLSSLSEKFAEAGVTVHEGKLSIENIEAFNEVVEQLIHRANGKEASLMHGAVAYIDNYSQATWKEILSLHRANAHLAEIRVSDFNQSTLVTAAEQELEYAQIQRAFGEAVDPASIVVGNEQSATLAVGGQEVRIEHGKVVAIGDVHGFSVDLASFRGAEGPQAIQAVLFDVQVNAVAGSDALPEHLEAVKAIAGDLHGGKGILSPFETQTVRVVADSDVRLETLKHGGETVDQDLVYLVEFHPTLPDAQVGEIGDGRDALAHVVHAIETEKVYEMVVDRNWTIQPDPQDRGVWVMNTAKEDGVVLAADHEKVYAQYASKVNPSALDHAEFVHSPVTDEAMRHPMGSVDPKNVTHATEVIQMREHAEQELLRRIEVEAKDSGRLAFLRREMQPEDLRNLFNDVTVGELERMDVKELGEKIGTGQTDDLTEVSAVLRASISDHVSRDLPVGQAISQSIAERVEAGGGASASGPGASASPVHSHEGHGSSEPELKPAVAPGPESPTPESGPAAGQPPEINNEIPAPEGGRVPPTAENPPEVKNDLGGTPSA